MRRLQALGRLLKNQLQAAAAFDGSFRFRVYQQQQEAVGAILPGQIAAALLRMISLVAHSGNIGSVSSPSASTSPIAIVNGMPCLSARANSSPSLSSMKRCG